MITELSGNIWDFANDAATIVIPTNIGWTSFNLNVMGAGLARSAAARHPQLRRKYGIFCKHHRAATPPFWYKDQTAPELLLLVPTKPLDERRPELSWRNHSTVDRVRQSLFEIRLAYAEASIPDAAVGRAVYLPLLGAGNGGLDPDLVREITYEILETAQRNFNLVTHPNGGAYGRNNSRHR